MAKDAGLTRRASLRSSIPRKLEEARSQSPELSRKVLVSRRTAPHSFSDSKGLALAAVIGRLVPARYVQLGLLFGSRLVQSVMRMAMGPLLVSICEDLECSPSSKGKLLSGFSLGYLTSQVVGGVLADKFGAKAVVFFATLVGSFLTALGGSATSVGQLWLAQVLLGVSQGPLFPTSIAFLSRWVPPEERALASTVLDTGITVGSLIALPCSGLLAASYGWRATLGVYGGLGCLFALLWWSLACPTPAECSYMDPAELKFLNKAIKASSSSASSSSSSSTGGRSSPKSVSSFSSTSSTSSSGSAGAPSESQAKKGVVFLLKHASVWAIFVSHMAFNFGVYFLTSWTPTYFKEVLGLRPETVGLALTVPPTCNCLVKFFVSTPLEDFLRKQRGYSTLQCRRFFSCVGFVGCSAGLLLVPLATQLYGLRGATVGFSLALGASALHPAGFKANYMDISVSSGGVVSGVGNTLASVASFVSPLAVGALLASQPAASASASGAAATGAAAAAAVAGAAAGAGGEGGPQGGWGAVFACIAAANLSAAFIFGTLSSATPID